MSNIKLIAIDVDGTLLDSKHQLTQPVIDAITEARSKGIYVVIATGRPLPGIKPFLEQLNYNSPNEYAITYNGSLVQEIATGKALVHYELSKDDYAYVDQVTRDFGTYYHAIDADHIYTSLEDMSWYTSRESYLVRMPIRYRALEAIPDDKNFTKMMVIDTKEGLDAFIASLDDTFTTRFNTLRSENYYLEILNPKASKGHALKSLAEHLGLEPDEVMALGDNENDLDMIQYAGYGVAMANSNPIVLKEANFITGSNDEAGVAQAIRKFALEE
ncbi:sugar-phosphatase [Bavariicoccus seileri]|uniref:sugar-phosphatase n=1 Tax=Bavariicoccus seileri TaxID=549685 RepID=UPI003F912040